jgi:hypothetical protein
MKKTTIVAILLTLLIPVSSAQASTKFLNTKNNKNACKFIKTKYKSEVLFDWANGNATNEDMLKEINKNIKMLLKTEKITSNEIKTAVKSWIVSENDTKMALKDKNNELILKAIDLKISSITKFDKMCKSIKS